MRRISIALSILLGLALLAPEFAAHPGGQGPIARPGNSGSGGAGWSCGMDTDCQILEDLDGDGDFGDDLQRALNELRYPNLTETAITLEPVTMLGRFTSGVQTVSLPFAKQTDPISFSGTVELAAVDANTGAITGAAIETVGTQVDDFATGCGATTFCSTIAGATPLPSLPARPESIVCEFHLDGDPAGLPDKTATIAADGVASGDVTGGGFGVDTIGPVDDAAGFNANGTYTLIWSGSAPTGATFCSFTGDLAANVFHFPTSEFSFGWTATPAGATVANYTSVDVGTIPPVVRIFPPLVAAGTVLPIQTAVRWCRGLPHAPPSGYETPGCEAAAAADESNPRLVFEAPWSSVWLDCDLSTQIAASDGRHFCIHLGDNEASSSVPNEDRTEVDFLGYVQAQLSAGTTETPIVGSPLVDYVGIWWLDGLDDSTVRLRFRRPPAGPITPQNNEINSALVFGGGLASGVEIETLGTVGGAIILNGRIDGLRVHARTAGVTHHIGTRAGINPPIAEFIDDAAGCRIQAPAVSGLADSMECQGFFYSVDQRGGTLGPEALIQVAGLGDLGGSIEVATDTGTGEIVEVTPARAEAEAETRWVGDLHIRQRGRPAAATNVARFHPGNFDASPTLTGRIIVDASVGELVLSNDSWAGIGAARYVNQIALVLTGSPARPAGVGWYSPIRANTNYNAPGYYDHVAGTTYQATIDGQGPLASTLCVVFDRSQFETLPARDPALADCSEPATWIPKSALNRFAAWFEVGMELGPPSTATSCLFQLEVEDVPPLYAANGQRAVYGGTAIGATGSEYREQLTTLGDRTRIPSGVYIPPNARAQVKVGPGPATACPDGSGCSCDGITEAVVPVRILPAE